MPDLFRVSAPEDALQRIESYLLPLSEVEKFPLEEALGRVLAEDVFASGDLPSFPRSAMDGYAVRASDTHGASEGLPAYLKVIGEVPMGRPAGLKVSYGEAALVHTGGMLAEGTDAVVMVENTQQVDSSTIEVLRPVAAGENVLQVGEDLHQGEMLLPHGQLLRAQDIGGLAALGISQVVVSRQPRVALISTGDELVPPQIEPGPGQVRNINTYTLSSLTIQAGGIPLRLGIIKDDENALKKAVERGLREGDIVVVTAGSSVSVRDMTAQVINSLGEPGILVHGIAIKPGKPTILAVIEGKTVIGLPGNPASAMVIFTLFVTPIIYRLSGCTKPPGHRLLQARLSHNIASISGREDYVPVRLEEQENTLWAIPVFGKSNFISTLIKAEGIVRVPLNKAGLMAGDIVEVRLF